MVHLLWSLLGIMMSAMTRTYNEVCQRDASLSGTYRNRFSASINQSLIHSCQRKNHTNQSMNVRNTCIMMCNFGNYVSDCIKAQGHVHPLNKQKHHFVMLSKGAPCEWVPNMDPKTNGIPFFWLKKQPMNYVCHVTVLLLFNILIPQSEIICEKPNSQI